MSSLSMERINELRHNARSVVRELGLLNDAYFEIGVTLAERHLLIELLMCPSPTLGEIAKRLLLDKSTVSRLISNAVKKGYVKCVTCNKDKRRRFLEMTEEGQKTLNAFEPIAFNQTKEALLTLTDYEAQIVHKGVALYAKGLKSSRLQNVAPRDETKSLPEIISSLSQLGFTLERFDEKDEEGLYEIFKEVVETGAQFPYESSSIDEFHRQFFSPQAQVYVCKTSQGEVVGGFYIKANYCGRSNHIANAAYMIRNSYRGKGLGSLLIIASLHLATDLGYTAMQFNRVFSQNKRVVNLYERLGFTIVGIIPEALRNPDGTFQNAYVMHRKLDPI